MYRMLSRSSVRCRGGSSLAGSDVDGRLAFCASCPGRFPFGQHPCSVQKCDPGQLSGLDHQSWISSQQFHRLHVLDTSFAVFLCRQTHHAGRLIMKKRRVLVSSVAVIFLVIGAGVLALPGDEDTLGTPGFMNQGFNFHSNPLLQVGGPLERVLRLVPQVHDALWPPLPVLC